MNEKYLAWDLTLSEHPDISYYYLALSVPQIKPTQASSTSIIFPILTMRKSRLAEKSQEVP